MCRLVWKVIDRNKEQSQILCMFSPLTKQILIEHQEATKSQTWIFHTHYITQNITSFNRQELSLININFGFHTGHKTPVSLVKAHCLIDPPPTHPPLSSGSIVLTPPACVNVQEWSTQKTLFPRALFPNSLLSGSVQSLVVEIT